MKKFFKFSKRLGILLFFASLITFSSCKSNQYHKERKPKKIKKGKPIPCPVKDC